MSPSAPIPPDLLVKSTSYPSSHPHSLRNCPVVARAPRVSPGVDENKERFSGARSGIVCVDLNYHNGGVAQQPRESFQWDGHVTIVDGPCQSEAGRSVTRQFF